MSMQITAWMNMPSPYQSRFFAALAQQPGVRVRMVYAYGISEDRAALGWKRIDDDAPYEIVMLRRPAWLHVCKLAWQRRHDYQLVNSLWAVPVFMPVRLMHAFVGRRPLLIHSEPSDPTLRRSPAKVWARNTFGRCIALTRRFGVFAISPLAEKQYSSLGFNRRWIYQFGYFNEGPGGSLSLQRKPSRRLVFVGQLIARKGWRVLFEALAELWEEFPELTLDIIGAGPDESQMRIEAGKSRASRVEFTGPVQAEAITSRLAAYDLLVLPSLFDGWGLVVNEALMAGVPVLVSNACGAACLVKEGINGFTFPSGEREALRDRLRQFLSMDEEARCSMRRAALSSAEAISLHSATAYFVACFRHAAGETDRKPVAPWLGSEVSEQVL